MSIRFPVRQRLARAARWAAHRLDREQTPPDSGVAFEARIERLELAVSALRGAATGNPLLIDAGVGIPAAVCRPNRRFSGCYRADRRGLQVRYVGNLFSSEQPDVLWLAGTSTAEEPHMITAGTVLTPGDRLQILDDDLYDFAVGARFVRVMHQNSTARGYITLETLLGETIPANDELWTAEEPRRLRALVAFETDAMPLYSTNRVGAAQVADSRDYLARFRQHSADGESAADVHPLQAGAHAHRLGCWSLARERTGKERDDVRGLIEGMFEGYALGAMREVAPGAWAWPYGFDFAMPWGTALRAPWYSGYANSAMAGAAACAYALSGNPAFADVVKKAVAFLALETSRGGAGYEIDGYPHIAEYVYATPPIPNYRVLDGELCSVVFLFNAATLLADSTLLAYSHRLAGGLANGLNLLSSRGDGLPYFGMDGQAMNPDYMWQLWMTLQLLANAFKDRSFSQRARDWRCGVPQHYFDDDAPG